MTGPAGSYDHRIGRIRRAHGLNGEIVLELFRPRRVGTARLRWNNAVDPQPVELELFDTSTELHGVVSAKFLDGATAILHLVDVDDRDAAERLVSAFLDVDPRRPPDLVTDEVDRWFGARVYVDDDAEPLGRVTDIRDNGAQALLLVGEEGVMIPFVDAFVAPEEREGEPVLRVRAIPGLLDANRPRG